MKLRWPKDEGKVLTALVWLIVIAICMLALSGCGTTEAREHRVRRVDTSYAGAIGPVEVPVGRDANGNLVTAKLTLPINLNVTEDTDEEAVAETKTKLDPALQAALTALQGLAEKGANAVAPGAGSVLGGLFNAFSSSGSPTSDMTTGGSLIGGALALAGSGYIAVRKHLDLKRESAARQVTEKALEDTISFSKEALAVAPDDSSRIEALKEKHRLRQIARGTNHVITQKL